jgi:hypothetical protein
MRDRIVELTAPEFGVKQGERVSGWTLDSFRNWDRGS